MKESDNWSDKEVLLSFFRMLKTIVMWVSWLILSLYFGIEQGWILFGAPGIPTWEHVLFVIWVVVMVPILIWVTFNKIWKNQ